MAEFKSAPTTETKKATANPKQEGNSESSELEYADNRSSTAQLVSLQSAADDKGNRSNTAQLQAKAALFTGTSRIAQLKAASDLRQPTASSAPVVQRQENKTGLPDNLKAGMESLSGLSMNDVKVHYSSDKPAQLQAHAYAQGTDIHLGPGQEKHLPHELGHVVQQKQGRVQPTTQLQSKVNINDDAGLEKEADVLGAKAMQFKAMTEFQASQINSTSSSFSSNTFQLAPKGAQEQEDLENGLSFEEIYPEKENKKFTVVNKISKEKSRKAAKAQEAVEMEWNKKGDRGTEKPGSPNREKSEAEQEWDKKGDRGTEKIDPNKINRREDDQWPIGPKNEDGKSVQDTSDIVTENKLDDDLWFKSSEGIEDVEPTEEHLPTYDKGIPSAFHVTTHEKSAGSILSRIDPRMHNPASRFGGGFYVATELHTSYAEIAAHEFDNLKEGGDASKGLLTAIHIIEYTGAGATDLVDATATEALATMVKKDPLKIEKKVRQEGRDGIVFHSTKGTGKNIVFYKNYGALQVKGDGYTGAAEGFKSWKEAHPIRPEINPI